MNNKDDLTEERIMSLLFDIALGENVSLDNLQFKILDPQIIDVNKLKCEEDKEDNMLSFIGSALMFVVWIVVGMIAFSVLLVLIALFLALISIVAEWVCELFRQ